MASHFGGLNIPPLQKGERISDWEKLFRAAMAPLLAGEGGGAFGDKHATSIRLSTCGRERDRERSSKRNREFERGVQNTHR